MLTALLVSLLALAAAGNDTRELGGTNDDGNIGPIVWTANTQVYLFCGSPYCYWKPSHDYLTQFKLDGGNLHVYDHEFKDTGRCLNLAFPAVGGAWHFLPGACGTPTSGVFAYANGVVAVNGYCLQNGPLVGDGTWAQFGGCQFGNLIVQPVLSFPWQMPCDLVSQTISDLKCVSPDPTTGLCKAKFTPGQDMTGAHSTQNCSACTAPKGDSITCTFDFGVTSQVSTTVTIQSGESISKTHSVTVNKGFSFLTISPGGGSKTDSRTVSGTFQLDEAVTSSESVTIKEGYQATVQAGTAAKAVADVQIGTLVGDFTATLTSTYQCPQKNHQTTVSGKITIKNLPTHELAGSVNLTGVPCPSPVPTPEQTSFVV